MPSERSWTPDSWRGRTALQQPNYADRAALAAVETELGAAPAVVAIADCVRLRELVGQAVTGGGFIVQGGDCAESLGDDPAVAAEALAALVDRLAEVIAPRVAGPLVRIGRVAGQFAKPRTTAHETRGGTILPVYRGDGINGAGFTAGERAADPTRMVAAYRHSVASAAALAGREPPLFTSHEALLLPYEQALARRDQEGQWWATSGHMLWAGERTRDPDGAHVEFLAGIGNAVGVKIGYGATASIICALARKLDMSNSPGRLLFIVRHGAERIGMALPSLLRAARSEGLAAGWMIDPMHGNTRIEHGRKRRDPEAIAREAELFVQICAAEGIAPSGVHLEMTPRAVAECGVADGDPPLLDPRLNPDQAEALAARIAALL